MFVLDDGGDDEVTEESLKKDYREHVYERWGNGLAIASHPTVVQLTTPEYSEAEQDYVGDQIAEMQEEIRERAGEESSED